MTDIVIDRAIFASCVLQATLQHGCIARIKAPERLAPVVGVPASDWIGPVAAALMSYAAGVGKTQRFPAAGQGQHAMSWQGSSARCVTGYVLFGEAKGRGVKKSHAPNAPASPDRFATRSREARLRHVKAPATPDTLEPKLASVAPVSVPFQARGMHHAGQFSAPYRKYICALSNI